MMLSSSHHSVVKTSCQNSSNTTQATWLHLLRNSNKKIQESAALCTLKAASLFHTVIMFEFISVSTFQGDLSSIVKCQGVPCFIFPHWLQHLHWLSKCAYDQIYFPPGTGIRLIYLPFLSLPESVTSSLTGHINQQHHSFQSPFLSLLLTLNTPAHLQSNLRFTR